MYNVKAVCLQTGITAATLRAWERRYGLPNPKRTHHGYRLYSDRDVALIFWLIQHIESGVNIGQAVHQLTNLLIANVDPHVQVPGGQPEPASGPRSPEALTRDLVNALTTLDERQVDLLLAEGQAIYKLETLLINVIRPALRAVQAQHAQAETPRTAARFGVNTMRQRLLSMTQATITHRDQRPVITLGFRGEESEIDLLIIGLILRRAGIPVAHLGSELDPVLLHSTLNELNAGMVFCYVDLPENAVRLIGFEVPHDTFGNPIWCACAGQALLTAAALRSRIPFEYLGDDLRAVARAILDRLDSGVRVRVDQRSGGTR